MKVTAEQQQSFSPVTFTIVCETQEEINALRAIVGTQVCGKIHRTAKESYDNPPSEACISLVLREIFSRVEGYSNVGD